MWGRLLHFIQDKTGVSAVEYALMVVAVIAIIGVGAATLGGAFKDLFGDLEDKMEQSVQKTYSDAKKKAGG